MIYYYKKYFTNNLIIFIMHHIFVAYHKIVVVYFYMHYLIKSDVKWGPWGKYSSLLPGARVFVHNIGRSDTN